MLRKFIPFKRRRPPSESPSWLEQRRRRRRIGYRLLIAGVVAAVAVVAVQTFMGLYVDWLWFGELGMRAVFWRRVAYGAVLGPAFAVFFFVVVYGSIELARRGAPRHQVFEGIADEEFVRHDAARAARRVGGIVTGLLAIVLGFRGAGAWLTFARAFHGQSFGSDDPIFHHDVGFYVFTLPAWEFVHGFLTATVVVALIAAIITHAALGAIELTYKVMELTVPGEETADGVGPAQVVERVRRINGVTILPAAVVQLSALLAALLLCSALGDVFQVWNLLYSNAGAVYGAGYTDVHVRMPLIRATMAVAALLAVWMIYNAARARRPRWIAAAAGIWLAVELVLVGLVPAAWQALFINPNQFDRELTYLGYELAATRSAYDLTAIDEASYPLTGDLTSTKLAANETTIGNVRMWDPETLQRSYKQLQQLRPYYSFTTVSVDRYRIKGEYQQTMLSPRELNVRGLPITGQTWVNQHITYTHGYGVAVSAVNEVSGDGSPEFLVQDVPVRADADVLAIDQPRIYFGLGGNDYTLVKTTNPEFDYPGKGGDVYQSYEGTGGIAVAPVLNRLAFAVRYGTIKFLTTNVFTDESRAIIRNNILERLTTAAPFLAFDSDPYMVIADGRLYWIADAYTTTDRVPYSEPYEDINYIRNSVKVVIDAYNGDMRLYVFDTRDPIIKAYQELFPGVLRPADEMDETLRQHVRYPEDIFEAQAQKFATYHVTDPGVLYNKGDQWQVPTNVSITGAGEMSPYYMIMRLPKAKREEFVLIMPFTPNLRSNMIGWLGAQSDPPNYGRAVSFQFPANLNVYGPAQVEAAVNQDPVISSQRTLWGQRGSRVIFGNLIVVPIENSLLYVQPLYLESEKTQLPQVQRVIVFYRSPEASPDLPSGQQQNVVMAATLADALEEIFGGAPRPQPSASADGATSARFARLAARANEQYAAAQEALKAGNLEEFGRLITALGKTLEQLQP